MHRVLIISPRFPPINAADHHRVRVALPHLREYGWEPTVICVQEKFVEAQQDDILLKTIPGDVDIRRVSAWDPRKTRKFKLGSLSIRSYGSINRQAAELLKTGKFDLVYFSTTEFGVLTLGPKWKRKFGIPYVVDLQDPWVNDYYKINGLRPPGGKLKHSLTQAFAKRAELKTLKQAAHMTVVSDGYTKSLTSKYSELTEDRFTTLPFAFSLGDFDVLHKAKVEQQIFNNQDGLQHWAYVGRCGPDMQHSLRSLLTAFRNWVRESDDKPAVRMYFIGTDYAPKGMERYWVKPIAEELGIVEYVDERPLRIGYFEALRCLIDADALIVPGSEDPSYTASKIYPYLAAGKPLLTVFHENSSVNTVLHETGGGVGITFGSSESVDGTSQKIQDQWFNCSAFKSTPQVDAKAFRLYGAEAMTHTLAAVFNNAIATDARTVSAT